MTCFRTFASGSSGNAALLSCGNTHLLIDMGISCRRICRALAEQGLTPEDLSAILIPMSIPTISAALPPT